MKIIFICEPASPHAARWINQLEGSGIEAHLISEDPHSSHISGDLRYGTVYLREHTDTPAGVKLVVTGAATFEDHVASIAEILGAVVPNLLHTLGMYVNHSNRCLILSKLRMRYPALRAVPWMYSSWGMDLDCFAKDLEHRTVIRAAVQQMDYYIGECERDIRTMVELGYQGKILDKFPAFGGVTWSCDHLPSLRERTDIILKGRDIEDGDEIGRGLRILPALLANREDLRRYRIICLQAEGRFRYVAEQLRFHHGLTIECIDRLPRQTDVLDFYRHARSFISMTTNDGLPSSLVEAMSLGAMPIFSDLSSLREWIRSGHNGLLVAPNDIPALSRAIRRMLREDSLCESAQQANRMFVATHWSDAVVRPSVLKMYQRIGTGTQLMRTG